MNKVAVIFGVTGQAGSFLLDLLLSKGYFVYGISRRVSNPNLQRLQHNLNNKNFRLIGGDITDTTSLLTIFNQIKSDDVEIYNCAAMSHVAISFEQPGLTWDVTARGHLNLLETIRHFAQYRNYKIFFCGSSEMFGSNVDIDGFQRETTPFAPNSPYATAKLAAFNINRIYREAYGLNTRSGIIFNMESPRRGENFVTRKITKYFGQLYSNPFLEKLKLGNIESMRDWSNCKDSVRAMWMTMQVKPKDYVIASSEVHSIKDFLLHCYDFIKDKISHIKPLEELYEIDKTLYRPCEVPYLCGDADLIKKDLGWHSMSNFAQLVQEMMLNDMKIFENQ